MVAVDKGEKRLLQIGGISGVLAGVLQSTQFLAPLLGVSAEFGSEVELRRILEGSSVLIGLLAQQFVQFLLFIPLFLALYRLLRGANVGYALLGSVAGVIGATLAVLAVSFEMTSYFFAELYNRAAPADKKIVVAVSEGISQAVTGGFFVALSIFLGVALLATGAAMLGGSSLRKWYGWMSIIFGIGWLLAGILLPLPNPLRFFFFLMFILFPVWLIVVGLNVYRLSKAA